jgi:hypothetical protein
LLDHHRAAELTWRVVVIRESLLGLRSVLL